MFFNGDDIEDGVPQAMAANPAPVQAAAPAQDEELDLPDNQPKPPLTTSEFLKGLTKKQQDADRTKAYLGVAGNVLQDFADIPTAYELLQKKTLPKADMKGLMSAAAAGVQDPMEQFKKKYQTVQQAKQIEAEAQERDPNSKTSMALKALAPRWGVQVTPEMSAYDIKQMIDPKKMMETEAQSRVNFDNDMEKLKFSKQADYERQMAEIAARAREAKQARIDKQSEGLTEGRKAVDKDFAKDYNEWNAGGRAAVEKNLKRLQDAYDALGQDSSLTGPVRGMFPDAIRNLTNEKAITTRDDVRAAAQGALKATLGNQFTEREGERIMNQAYNEKLSPEANKAKIKAAIAELVAKRNAMEAKSQHFEKHGTLNGFEASAPSMVAGDRAGGRTVVKSFRNKRTGEVKNVYSDGSEEIVPATAGN